LYCFAPRAAACWSTRIEFRGDQPTVVAGLFAATKPTADVIEGIPGGGCVMKYLCLGYYDPDKYDALSEAEKEALGPECRPHDEALRASGGLRSVASLQHRTALTLRPKEGEPSITDGPFTETKEVVGSFFIIEAEDLEAAVRIASLHPAAKLGAHLGWAVEVRPIEHYSDLGA
jgi:hypothetical protein